MRGGEASPWRRSDGTWAVLVEEGGDSMKDRAHELSDAIKRKLQPGCNAIKISKTMARELVIELERKEQDHVSTKKDS